MYRDDQKPMVDNGPLNIYRLYSQLNGGSILAPQSDFCRKQVMFGTRGFMWLLLVQTSFKSDTFWEYSR